MPGGMDGMMLADRIRALDGRVGVLMTTGYNEQLVTDGNGRSATDVLGNPYRRSELLDCIDRL